MSVSPLVAHFLLDASSGATDNYHVVARFRIDSIADLARQLEFAPQEVRLAQVRAAEELLCSIDPAKAYPFEFVVFRITAYHPKTLHKDLLIGMALQHDLGLLIEQVSESLNLHTQTLAEPVLTIEDVTERFNVTSKTIQRWRRRGLPARRFIFPDGKRRVGFLLSSVERFISTHSDQVARGSNFSQVDDAERDEIIRRARRLAVTCRCCVPEICRRVGRKMNRSPLTILHIVKKHDQECSSEAIFARATESIPDPERTAIVKAYRRGVALGTLARRFCLSRSSVYRVILDERLARLNKKKVRFIDDPLYHQPDALSVLQALVRQPELAPSPSREDVQVPRDLPPYLQDLYRTALLTPAQERALFLKLNYHKFQFVTARRKLEPQFARSRDLSLLEQHLKSATETKNEIVRANLRLVVSVARRHLRPGLTLMELVSDGNITLMRAVDGFDMHKGNRFSTYATLALMKGFARSVPAMQAAARRAASVDEDVLTGLPDRRLVSDRDRFFERDEVRSLLSRLDDSERRVLTSYYGLGDKSEAATYEQVGQRLGLSKHRVRQIEQTAILKLRQILRLS